MKCTQGFTNVIRLATCKRPPSIAHAVVTFWPGQNPSARGVGIVFSADDGRVTKYPKMAFCKLEKVAAFSGEISILSSLHLSSGVVHDKVNHPLCLYLLSPVDNRHLTFKV